MALSCLDLTRTLLMERRYSYNIINSIPKDRGDFKPQPEMMTVAEQLAHIGAFDEWLVQGVKHQSWSFDIYDDRPEKTVEEALAFMEHTRRRLMEMIEELGDEGLARPLGSNPVFTSDDTPQAGFIPDLEGFYKIGLTVYDGMVGSLTDTMIVHAVDPKTDFDLDNMPDSLGIENDFDR